MRNKLSLLVVLIITIQFAHANPYRDSLRTVYNNTSLSDSIRFMALYQLAWYPEDTDTTLHYARILEFEAKNSKNYYSIGQANVRYSQVSAQLNNFSKALEYNHRALFFYRRANVELGDFYCFVRMYVYHFHLENQDSASFYHSKLESIYHALPETDYQTKRNLCVTVINLLPPEEIDRALYWRLELLNVYKVIGSKRDLVRSYSWIAFIKKQNGEQEEALLYDLKALSLAKEIGYFKQIEFHNSSISIYYEHKGDFSVALEYLYSSIEVLNPSDTSDVSLNAYINLGNFYRRRDNYKMAVKYLMK